SAPTRFTLASRMWRMTAASRDSRRSRTARPRVRDAAVSSVPTFTEPSSILLYARRCSASRSRRSRPPIITTTASPTGSRRMAAVWKPGGPTRMPDVTGEVLLTRPDAVLRRSGRFVVAELVGAHHVLSTSVRNGGQTTGVRFLLNHQSCEGAAHLDRH